MTILYVYNYYQNPGGEDQAFAAESALMEAKGHRVFRYTMHNDAIAVMNRLSLAGTLMWNRKAHRDIYALVRDRQIDVVHFHNTFPLISPAAYYAAKSAGARVVHTLHNFRLICPGALLLRDGRVCEDCLGKATPWRAVVNSCYRDSAIQSAAVATMLTGHRLTGTWHRQIDRYIALTEFARNKFIEGGLPASLITIKPNFVDSDPGTGNGHGGYALFVGRLSREKGIEVLLRAWKVLGHQIPLKIAGDGPLAPEVRSAAVAGSGIDFLGRRRRDEVLQLMREASCLIFPSLWYEGFPMTIAEAYASGLPVVASDLGSMMSIVKHRLTGLRFAPGNAEALISAIHWLRDHADEAEAFRVNARRDFTLYYSSATNYSYLMQIYRDVTENRPAQEAA